MLWSPFCSKQSTHHVVLPFLIFLFSGGFFLTWVTLMKLVWEMLLCVIVSIYFKGE